MGAVPANKSGVGSAMNDATREFGATLGVAILGSVFASIYRSKLAKTNLSSVPAEALRSARSSIGGAYIAAEQLTRAGEIQPGKLLLQSANRGFFDGYQTACLTAAVVTALGAVFALRYLPGQPVPALDHQTSAPAQPIPAD